MPSKDLFRLKIEAHRKSAASLTKVKRRSLWTIIVGVLAVISVGFLAWFGILRGPVEVQAVKVSSMFPSRALTILNASGYVVAQRKAAVSSKATGRIEQLHVEEGKFVKEGDIIAQLENQDLKATLDEAGANLRVTAAALKNAEAELEDATLNYNRHKALRESGAVSEQAFDTAEARFKKARAMETSARFSVDRAEHSVKVAEVNLEYSLIRAPFDGVILTKNADKGEVVAPFGAALNAKAAVATMADLNSLMVEVDVAESSLEKVKTGAAAEIRLDALPGERFLGTVHMIVPTADRSKATVLTKVVFNKRDDRVLPEMSTKVAFLERPLRDDELEAFLGIPASAIRKDGNRDLAFRINDNRIHAVPVKIGRGWGATLEILSGLKQGDLIVLQPHNDVTDGTRVKVKE
ncbi:MAG TPA: efflux RND transporter periplasmic adaptor subunit [Desulfomonilaceae bacterium]|nr:efflux RND transporter periplasmic adaptor subunit [Desulfomonilaceae bacterium]